MSSGSGHFEFESIVIATLAILVIATLSVFAHAAFSPVVVI
jgi:hypothetical protein